MDAVQFDADGDAGQQFGDANIDRPSDFDDVDARLIGD